jgi:hypothetical protein
MGTDYRRRLQAKGRWNPEKDRVERKESRLRALMHAWVMASEPVKAQFMVECGLRPDPDEAPGPLTPQELEDVGEATAAEPDRLEAEGSRDDA